MLRRAVEAEQFALASNPRPLRRDDPRRRLDETPPNIHQSGFSAPRGHGV
jgi:hypothetical protein